MADHCPLTTRTQGMRCTAECNGLSHSRPRLARPQSLFDHQWGEFRSRAGRVFRCRQTFSTVGGIDCLRFRWELTAACAPRSLPRHPNIGCLPQPNQSGCDDVPGVAFRNAGCLAHYQQFEYSSSRLNWYEQVNLSDCENFLDIPIPQPNPK
jgi:hypothetical protein